MNEDPKCRWLAAAAPLRHAKLAPLTQLAPLTRHAEGGDNRRTASIMASISNGFCRNAA